MPADVFVSMYKVSLGEYAYVTEKAFVEFWEPLGWILQSPVNAPPAAYFGVQAQLDAHAADLAIHSSGRRLDAAELLSTQIQTNNVAKIVTGCIIEFDVTTRPVSVKAHAGYASHTTVGHNVQLLITGPLGTPIQRRDGFYAAVANAFGGVNAKETIETPGHYIREMWFVGSLATANTATVMLANLGDAYIEAVEQ